ncbi:hypothetical protein COK83_17375, partial [Bacillus thuringiensis]
KYFFITLSIHLITVKIILFFKKISIIEIQKIEYYYNCNPLLLGYYLKIEHTKPDLFMIRFTSTSSKFNALLNIFLLLWLWGHHT